MKMYVKPSINVIELQLTENIAAVPTTVYKGSTAAGGLAQSQQAYNLALSQATTGVNQGNLDSWGISAS